MRKLPFFAVFVVLLATFVAGCGNLVKENGSKSGAVPLTEEAKQVISQYSGLGAQHNEMLYDFYFDNDSLRSVAAPTSQQYKSLSISDYFGQLDKVCYFDSMDSSQRNAVGTGMTAQMVEQDLISPGAAGYIARVESILINPLDSLEATQNAITAVEAQAIPQLSGTDLDQFMSYAETAKASLDFWADNYATLSGETDEDSARFFSWIRKKWDEYKHKLAMMAASDAAGAAAGAVVGASIGAGAGGIGAVAGAAIGAAAASVASSAQGFQTGKLCVVIPLEKIKQKM